MAKFMLLLYDNPAKWQDMSPEDMQKAVGKYMAWKEKLIKKGIYAGSDRLQDDGRVMRKSSGQVRVSDGPFAESKEVFGGHFTIDVATYDKAVDECRDCPHLDYGGTIEVRQVFLMPGAN